MMLRDLFDSTSSSEHTPTRRYTFGNESFACLSCKACLNHPPQYTHERAYAMLNSPEMKKIVNPWHMRKNKAGVAQEVGHPTNRQRRRALVCQWEDD